MRDIIYRQAAIDAIDRLDIPEDMCVFEILSHIELEIGTLPSAQPDNRLAKIADLVEGTIDDFDLDDAMDLLYQIKEVLK